VSVMLMVAYQIVVRKYESQQGFSVQIVPGLYTKQEESESKSSKNARHSKRHSL
jgi:hypothetical protein